MKLINQIIKSLRSNIPADSGLYILFKKINTRFIFNDYWGNDLLNAYANWRQKPFFIQVGSNDGIKSDPLYSYIRKYHWPGILIEPIPYIYNNLVNNYTDLDSQLIFENVAIDKSNCSKDIYRLRISQDQHLPSWYDQLASFHKEVIISHKKWIPDIEQRIITEPINCITFDELIKRNHVRQINLLQIDTEGYDAILLKLFPFKQFKPEIIIFEHKHLSRIDELKCRVLLKSKGYIVHLDSPSNTLAIRKDIMASLILLKK